MTFSSYLKQKMMEHAFRAQAFTSPTIYCALTTGGAEVAGGAYARQVVTFAAWSTDHVANAADIAFPRATSSWGTVDGYALYDALTGGNVLTSGALPANTVGANKVVTIPAGTLVERAV